MGRGKVECKEKWIVSMAIALKELNDLSPLFQTAIKWILS